jgi:AbrB family looped-hinge helix DNA binding protein
MIDGILCTMRTTIDKAGRVVVPKALRRATGLEAGSEVEIRANDGRIEMEPAPLEVRLERRRGMLVAVPVRPVPAMAAAVVEGTITSLRARSARHRRAR